LLGPLALKDNRYVHQADNLVVPLLDGQPLLQISEILSRTVYIGPFRNAINTGTETNRVDKYFDIHAGPAFMEEWKYFKSGYDKKKSELCFRLESQIKSIFGYDDLQINSFAHDKDLQIIANGKSYKSSDMGAGILQFVIVLANAALASPQIILIDEPELSLHPVLQLDFLTTLGSYATHAMIFATHSIGLARAAAERIYSVRKLSRSSYSELKPFEGNKNLSALLGELGFNSYLDLGFSKVLLVEGPSDVKAIQQLLRQLGKEHKILLLPLGGNGMINGNIDVHLQEIQRIGANVSALIDSERTHLGDKLSIERQAFAEKCRENKIECCILAKRAFENYLMERAIKIVKGEKYSALAPYQKLKDAPLPWAKEENWLIAREMERGEWEQSDLGEFLISL
jgi:predicted ATPase